MTHEFPLTATATFLDGGLKLDSPLDLPAGTRLTLIICPAPSGALDAEDVRIIQQIVEEDREVFRALAQ